MIVQIIGWLCLFFAVCNFIGVFTSKLDEAWHEEVCFCLYLICAAICFK